MPSRDPRHDAHHKTSRSRTFNGAEGRTCDGSCGLVGHGCCAPAARSGLACAAARRAVGTTFVSPTAVPIQPSERLDNASAPPERPGNTTHASSTPGADLVSETIERAGEASTVARLFGYRRGRCPQLIEATDRWLPHWRGRATAGGGPSGWGPGSGAGGTDRGAAVPLEAGLSEEAVVAAEPAGLSSVAPPGEDRRVRPRQPLGSAEGFGGRLAPALPGAGGRWVA